MERIEVVENNGHYKMDCEAVDNRGCEDCPLYRYVLKIGCGNTWEAFIKFNLVIKSTETTCYTLYKYIKEMEEKVRVWKSLR
jgi:hypothetical protein